MLTNAGRPSLKPTSSQLFWTQTKAFPPVPSACIHTQLLSSFTILYSTNFPKPSMPNGTHFSSLLSTKLNFAVWSLLYAQEAYLHFTHFQRGISEQFVGNDALQTPSMSLMSISTIKLTLPPKAFLSSSRLAMWRLHTFHFHSRLNVTTALAMNCRL